MWGSIMRYAYAIFAATSTMLFQFDELLGHDMVAWGFMGAVVHDGLFVVEWSVSVIPGGC